MTRTTRTQSYAVLNADGEIIERSDNYRDRQDPASTTKLWTLYTVMSMIRDGHLPPDFIEQHRSDIEPMMVRSNNQATERVAVAADIASGGSGRVSNGRLDAVPGFAEWMNRYASGDLSEGTRALEDTNFVTASGMPHPNHYSSAYDMALMMYRFRTDFEGTSVEQYLGLAGQSRFNDVSDNLELAKTGTARGHHGSAGAFALVGAAEGGVFAFAGVPSRTGRVNLAQRYSDIAAESGTLFASALPGTDAAIMQENEGRPFFEFLQNLPSLSEVIEGSASSGIYLANALLSRDLIDNEQARSLYSDGISFGEMAQVLRNLQENNVVLDNVDLSNFDFNNDGQVNTGDVMALTSVLSGMSR